VNSIIEDLHWLGADPNGGIFYGSDYFDKCYEYAEKLIMEGKAYVDDLTRDEMREYRGADAGKPSRPSPWRDRTPEENLDLFRRMRAGEFQEGEKTLRAKIDLASPNMNMRDPAIYRIKYAEHHRQGRSSMMLFTYSSPSRAGLVSSRRGLNLPPYWFAMDQLM
jgi:glutaminyl-tRNA synthetase